LARVINNDNLPLLLGLLVALTAGQKQKKKENINQFPRKGSYSMQFFNNYTRVFYTQIKEVLSDYIFVFTSDISDD